LHLTHRVRKALLSVSCAIACAAILPSAAGAVVVGIGDQATTMFSDPRFLALGVHETRLTVSWNVASARSRRGELRGVTAWLSDAAADNITPLISFSGIGNYIPTVGQYTRAIQAFIHRFPKVKRYSPWNEPDWIYRSISRHPLLAASFFNTLVRHCHGCSVVAGDLYLASNQGLGTWIRAYRKGLRSRPAGWALHNYNDVRTHSTSQLRTLMKLTSGPIWLDEISGVETRGHWQYRNQSDAAAGRDEKFLFSLARRFKRISRIYHYQWRASPIAGWDSALISATGRPRPAYYVVQHAAG
jgi:Glycosyl hydrolase catalytic core